MVLSCNGVGFAPGVSKLENRRALSNPAVDFATAIELSLKKPNAFYHNT